MEKKLNEPMKNHTSFKVGGPADVMVFPENVKELKDILYTVKEKKEPFFILGNGSNLVVGDKGIRGVVINLSKNFRNIKVEKNYIEAECGVLLSKAARTAYENSLSGLEFASGIPGSVGGAVYMNAGAYDGEMKDVVYFTKCMDINGNEIDLYGEEHDFAYRRSVLNQRNLICIKTRMLLKNGNKADIKGKMDELNGKRTAKQPIEYPSAGSVFKRPEGYFAGKLIADCGLKGFAVGGAAVSEKHAGFIINKGNAAAKDIADLVELIKEKVRKKHGVELETEIKFIGEF